MRVSILFLSFVFITVSNAFAATCTSLGSSQWDDPANWSCGVVPSAGDSIIILAGHTITVSSNFNMNGTASHIVLSGHLLFDSPGAKLRLGCGSTITINAGGSISSSGNGTASHSIRICNADVWVGGTGPIGGPLVIGINPLPVELTSFSASVSRGKLLSVEWKTASETNSSYFSVLGSEDGVDWIELERVNAAGTSNEELTYSVEMNRNNSEYLMLKQVDIDGAFNFSKAIALERSTDNIFNVYPNPINGNRIVIESSFSNAEINIYNQYGRVVLSQSDFGNGELFLESESFVPGVYIISITNGDSILSKKILKL